MTSNINRRTFIKITNLTALSLLFRNILQGCNEISISLKNILEKSDDFLSAINYNGDNNFKCYNLSSYQYTHASFRGDEAFIYSKNNVIVGFTIKVNNINNLEQNLRELTRLYIAKTLSFENDFGKEYYWLIGNKKIKLAYISNKDIPQYTFYTEVLNSANLVL